MLAGATVTSLATWLDEEWVTAGVDGDAGLGASTFEIEQRVAGDAVGAFTDRESAGLAGVIDFGALAGQLSPGAVVFGWVEVRAAADSVSGDLDIVSDYTAGDSTLGDVLTYGARVVSSTADCSTGGWAAGAVVTPDATALSGGSTADFELVAGTGGAAGAAKVVCFRIAFPAAGAPGQYDALQGVDADVVWYFDATSK